MTTTRAKQLATWLLVSVITLTSGCTALLSREARLASQLDEILTRLDDSGATVTARVLELPDRRELYARDIDVPYTPASNMKIPVSAAGLDMFGPDHTFKTYLAQDGDDLWIIGTGDPGLGDPRLAKRRGETPVTVLDKWADALAERGVKRITGDLYYYEDAFDDEWAHSSWGDDTLHWYGAPVTGLIFNDNCIDITIFPTEPGQPVRWEVMPPVENITVINECVTAEKHEPTIEKLREGDIYKIGGTCAKQVDLKSKPVGDPGAFLCDALRTHLAKRGIEVAGEIKRARKPLDNVIPPPASKLVATYETSMPDVIGRINTNSQNLFAEAICKLTGQAYAARAGRQVPGSWSDGEQAMRAFLRELGVDDSGFAVADGSGLSDDNKVTSRMLTDLFAGMYARADGPVFMESLAKGGVDGTLQKRFAGLNGHVFAKTGYIEGVRSLSGYVRTSDDEWLTFSIIYNHIPGSVKPYEALQDEAVKLLIQWPEID